MEKVGKKVESGNKKVESGKKKNPTYVVKKSATSTGSLNN